MDLIVNLLTDDRSGHMDYAHAVPVLVSVFALVLWAMVVRHAYRSGRKTVLLLAAALPPVLVVYDLGSWLLGLGASILPGWEVRANSVLLELVSGGFWMVSLNSGLEIVGLSGAGAPWTLPPGSTDFLGCFPTSELFEFLLLGFATECSVVATIGTGASWIFSRVAAAR